MCARGGGPVPMKGGKEEPGGASPETMEIEMCLTLSFRDGCEDG